MSIVNQLSALSQYQQYLQPHYQRFPFGRYASLIIIRKTESETIFRTEGSGEGLSKELVTAGIKSRAHIRRIVISKRKQTAVERRAGRELLREHNLLGMIAVKGKKSQPCSLNTNAPCGECIDCMLYGYAVGGGGAQKSRVMTDDAYSLGTVPQVTSKRTFNATFDNGTMRNPLTGEASTSINEDEYVLPETHFLDVETLKDVTLGELQYVIGNVLRSSRYGAISSRLGRVRNTIAAIVFSDTEIFSNLELTQQVYDLLKKQDEGDSNHLFEIPFPLDDEILLQQVHVAIEKLQERIIGREPVILQGEQLGQVMAETRLFYKNTEHVQALLQEITRGYKAETLPQ
jgi:CRISPR-associated protein Csc2